MSASDSSDDRASRIHATIGTGCLIFAAVIACLAFVDGAGGLPFWMPRSWYTARPLWYLLGLGGVVAGFLLLGNRADGDAPDPGSSTALFKDVVLYTRPGCHLCEDALALLHRYRRFLPPIQLRNIDDDPDLQERFGTCIPVVEIDGRVRFRGRVNEVLLRRMIGGAETQADQYDV